MRQEVKRWKAKDGTECFIIQVGLGPHKYYWGYAIFNNPLHESMVEFVQVHGGLTCREPLQEGPGFLYGFDCAHIWDSHPDSPTHDINWVVAETERMVVSIKQLMLLQYVLVSAEARLKAAEEKVAKAQKEVEEAEAWIRSHLRDE